MFLRLGHLSSTYSLLILFTVYGVCAHVCQGNIWRAEDRFCFFLKFWRQSLTVQPGLELRALSASQMLGRKVRAITPNNRLSAFGKNEGTSLK